MNGWKIQELRAAVLSDLRDFIPKNYYINVRTDDDISFKDITLSNRLMLAHYTEPKFTPRQLAAIWMLEKIAEYCHPYTSPDPAADAAEGITPESIKVMSLGHLHDALRRYAAYLAEDEAKALLNGINAPAESAPKSDDKVTSNWILLVQSEAATLWRKLKGMNCSPTKNNIKADLAKICREKEIKTDHGIYPTADYIYRHVLGGWTPPTD